MNSTDTVADTTFLDQPFESILEQMVAETITLMDWHFYLDGKAVTTAMISGNRALLPAILWNAAKTHQTVTGCSIGVQFRSDGAATLGAQASISEKDGRVTRSLFPLYCLDTLCASIENFPSDDYNVNITPQDLQENIRLGRKVPPRGAAATVDHLVHAFFADYESNMLPWTPDSNPKALNLAWAQLGYAETSLPVQGQTPA